LHGLPAIVSRLQVYGAALYHQAIDVGQRGQWNIPYILSQVTTTLGKYTGWYFSNRLQSVMLPLAVWKHLFTVPNGLEQS